MTDNMTDASMFDFNSMAEAIGSDPFAEKSNKFAKDERFYTLTKDKETGKGAAIIRFLPDSEKGMIQKMSKINSTVIKNGKKRFVSEFSPSTIGQPCPFQEAWQELWNEGDKEGAKVFGRGQRYITNIKVLKDPAKPENEGKIFLFEMSATMKDKIQQAINPSEQDRELGAQPKELYNPLKGNSFKLATKKGSNGIITYDPSEVITEVTSIYDSVDEALEDIKNNTYKLSDLLKPEAFMSYEELQKKKDWVTFQDMNVKKTNQPLTAEVASPEVSDSEVQPVETQPVETQPAAETPKQENKSQDLDSLLDDLV